MGGASSPVDRHVTRLETNPRGSLPSPAPATPGCTFQVAARRDALVSTITAAPPSVANFATISRSPRTGDNHQAVKALANKNVAHRSGYLSALLHFLPQNKRPHLGTKAWPHAGQRFVSWTGCVAIWGAVAMSYQPAGVTAAKSPATTGATSPGSPAGYLADLVRPRLSCYAVGLV